jgi:uncharacterized membrane protein YcaP (DUF421 family)
VSFLHKLLIGETPPWFAAEVALRITVLYVMLVTAMRLMGRRMSSQLTRAELLALVALAAAIGPSVQDFKRGLLPPLLSAVLIVVVHRLQARLTARATPFERFFYGDAALLVDDGMLNLKAMRANAISRERLFAELRAKGVYGLGAVERAYLESNGGFSILLRPTPLPGLSLVPPWDRELLSQQRTVAGVLACTQCARVAPDAEGGRACERCGEQRWMHAVDGREVA